MEVVSGGVCPPERLKAWRYLRDQYWIWGAFRLEGATVRRRKPRCFDPKSGLVVPGHDAIIRVRGGARGGARGCIRRSKISMMIMRPPQHGHGGRGSSGAVAAIVSGAGFGATASSSRARATFILRPPLASRAVVADAVEA